LCIRFDWRAAIEELQKKRKKKKEGNEGEREGRYVTSYYEIQGREGQAGGRSTLETARGGVNINGEGKKR